MKKHFRKLFLLSMLFGFFLPSCKEDDSENRPTVDSGDFNVSITGAVNKEMEGDAIFTHSIIETQASEGSQLQILLINEDNQDEFISITIMVRDEMEGVDPGTYTVNHSSGDAPFVTIYYTSDENIDYIATNTGTINLAERDENSAWGDFSAKLVEIQNQTVEISGEFNAEANQ